MPAVAAYCYMFHKRNLRVVRKRSDTLKSRGLEEEVALKVLETAYNAVADPLCGPQKLLQHMEELENVKVPGWAFLFKVLDSTHPFGADLDYVGGVKQRILH